MEEKQSIDLKLCNESIRDMITEQQRIVDNQKEEIMKDPENLKNILLMLKNKNNEYSEKIDIIIELLTKLKNDSTDQSIASEILDKILEIDCIF